jgi:hypothetical protein
MTGNVTVAAGVTLTIEPGVVVQGNVWYRSLRVNGSLSAVGTSAQPITFTSTSDSAPAQWLGITFASGAGASTLKHARIRYGGGAVGSDSTGLVQINGGTITIEDSTISDSSVSGIAIHGGMDGTAATATIRRTKVEENGFYGTSNGDGINVINARIVVEDSAFWSNKDDGLDFGTGATFTPTPSEISGTSSWDNERYGVYMDQDIGAEGLGPDGNISGKPGNAIYNNGTFGYSVTETWQQLRSTRHAPFQIDWRGTYWGEVWPFGGVTHQTCWLGTMNGHLAWGGAPDPDPNTELPVNRGPVSHKVEFVSNGQTYDYCANDNVLTNPPATTIPAVYFPPPS